MGVVLITLSGTPVGFGVAVCPNFAGPVKKINNNFEIWLKYF